MLSSSRGEPFEVEDWELVHQTDRAILVRVETGEEHWLPKSQIDFEWEPDGDKRLSMPYWLARKLGLTD